ncbi:hypothetical protein LTR10_001495 [Elasticomyces elasticus]|nr:hypothetical protein LTR10_001495 [Elasticomyces elasticus]KAK4974998.1 hypothetical protein LTR42_004207 [Elasticomyces elasticus]
MPGTTNWESAETWQRVVASMLATGIKVDLKATATAYGCTYDTLENRFRKLKKLAATLKEEVDNGERGDVAVPARVKSAPVTPRKPKTLKKDPLSAVANGRVSKTSPSKKVKKEHLESTTSEASDTGMGMGMGMGMDSFSHNEDLNFTGDNFFDA